MKGARFQHAPGRLQRPDDEGSNWDRSVILTGPHGKPAACKEAADYVVDWVAARYNLAE